MTLDLAVLVSGGGSNLQSIIDKVEAGLLDARIRLVFSNKPEAFGLERARRHGIPQASFLHTEFPDRKSFDREVVRVIRDHGADTLALAGYMRLLTPWFLEQFPGRVINIHPALLPSFPGVHGQADAAAYGVKLSGCTVHFVNEVMDNGPVIIQAAVPALPKDDGSSLGARILEYEHRIYPQALAWFAQGRLAVDGRKVVLRDDDRPKAQLHAPALVNPPLEEGF